MQTGHNLAHATTDELSWHAQTCDLIVSLESKLEHQNFPIYQLWAHQFFMKCIPGWNMESAWGSAFELSLTFEGWLLDQIRDQRPISLTIFTSQFKFEGNLNFFFFSSKFLCSHHHKILQLPWQPSCHGMCKICCDLMTKKSITVSWNFHWIPIVRENTLV